MPRFAWAADRGTPYGRPPARPSSTRPWSGRPRRLQRARGQEPRLGVKEGSTCLVWVESAAVAVPAHATRCQTTAPATKTEPCPVAWENLSLCDLDGCHRFLHCPGESAGTARGPWSHNVTTRRSMPKEQGIHGEARHTADRRSGRPQAQARTGQIPTTTRPQRPGEDRPRWTSMENVQPIWRRSVTMAHAVMSQEPVQARSLDEDESRDGGGDVHQPFENHQEARRCASYGSCRGEDGQQAVQERVCGLKSLTGNNRRARHQGSQKDHHEESDRPEQEGQEAPDAASTTRPERGSLAILLPPCQSMMSKRLPACSTTLNPRASSSRFPVGDMEPVTQNSKLPLKPGAL